MSGNNRKALLAEMLKADPDDPELRYMLAMEHVSSGEDAEAVTCLQEVVAQGKVYPPAYHQMGRALVRLGRIAEAREILQLGITIAMRCGDAHAAREMRELMEGLE